MSMVISFKKHQSNIIFLTDIDVVRKGIRDAICHASDQFFKANNEYMKHYDKNKESPHLKHTD